MSKVARIARSVMITVRPWRCGAQCRICWKLRAAGHSPRDTIVQSELVKLAEPSYDEKACGRAKLHRAGFSLEATLVHSDIQRSCRSTRLGAMLLVVLAWTVVSPLAAADATFVGVMALAVEKDVANQLGLSDEEISKLNQWIDDREAEATELVLSSRGEPEEKRREKIRQFAQQSEQLGLKLLTPSQQARLNQLRVQRAGMSALGEPAMQRQLELTDKQIAQVDQLLAERAAAMTRGGASQRESTRASYERHLADVLTAPQRTAWQQMAGIAGDETALVDVGDEKPADPAAEDEDNTAKDDTDDKDEPRGDNGDEATADDAPRSLDDVKLRFNFRYAPWKTVLEWFAEQSDLSLEMTTTPPGTFNYTDRRAYSPSEAIDLINSVLLTKGYTLLRHRRMLMVINLEDGIPPNLVEIVPVEELQDRGKFELVSVLFRPDRVSPEEAEQEIRKLLGPQGSIVVLPKTGGVLVTETGGRLRMIRDLLLGVESDDKAEGVLEVPLKNVLAEEVLGVIRQLMGLPEDRNASTDGTLRIAVDALGTRLFVTGEADKVRRVEEILKLVDVPDQLDDTGGAKSVEAPQLEVYSISSAEPESVLKVLQTLLAGLPDVRLDVDPKSGNLVALARPTQHATIRATIDQMQQDARQIEVIQLRFVDPQLAVLSINKLFGATEEGAAGRAPTVDADPTSGQLLIRATDSQIKQIRTLLKKMGEGDLDDASQLATAQKGNVRMLPITGRNARSALEQLELVWPTMRPNKIRVVTPSAAVRTMRNGQRDELAPDAPRGFPQGRLPNLEGIEGFDDFFQRFEIKPRTPAIPADDDQGPKATPDEQPPAPAEDQTEESPDKDVSASLDAAPKGSDVFFASQRSQGDRGSAAKKTPDPLGASVRFRLIAQRGAAPEDTGGADAADNTKPAGESDAADEETPAKQTGPPTGKGKSPAEIIVAPGPHGILIASEDLEALDEFESLIQTLASQTSSGRQYTVFYLKYARAEVASALLSEVLGGGSGGGDTGGAGGGLMGDLASAALGDAGGGLVGTLLGLGGGGGSITTTGSVTMVADQRLNALIVQANAADLDTIEQLLEVIDQEASPEDVQTFSRPRMIPVFNTRAEDIAQVVRQVYANRLTGSSGRQRQPSPEEFIRALRGGRGRGGSNRGAEVEEQPMTVGVDARSNSLVVSASEPLFQEVKLLVQQLDQAGAGDTETVQVVTLKSASPELVRQALVSITGGKVQASTSSVSDTSSRRTDGQSPRRDGNDRPQPTSEEFQDQMRRRIEFFNMLQRGGDQNRGGRDSGRGDGDSGRGGSSRGEGRPTRRGGR